MTPQLIGDDQLDKSDYEQNGSTEIAQQVLIELTSEKHSIIILIIINSKQNNEIDLP